MYFISISCWEFFPTNQIPRRYFPAYRGNRATREVVVVVVVLYLYSASRSASNVLSLSASFTVGVQVVKIIRV